MNRSSKTGNPANGLSPISNFGPHAEDCPGDTSDSSANLCDR